LKPFPELLKDAIKSRGQRYRRGLRDPTSSSRFSMEPLVMRFKRPSARSLSFPHGISLVQSSTDREGTLVFVFPFHQAATAMKNLRRRAAMPSTTIGPPAHARWAAIVGAF